MFHHYFKESVNFLSSAILLSICAATVSAQTPENPKYFKLWGDKDNHPYGDLVVTGNTDTLCLSYDARTNFPSQLRYYQNGWKYYNVSNLSPLPKVRLEPCKSSDNQVFIYDGTSIINKASGLCLTTLNEYNPFNIQTNIWEQPISTSSNIRRLSTSVALKSCNGANNQDWELFSYSGGRVKLASNGGTGECIFPLYKQGAIYLNGATTPTFRMETNAIGYMPTYECTSTKAASYWQISYLSNSDSGSNTGTTYPSGTKVCEFNDPSSGTTSGCTEQSVGGYGYTVAYSVKKDNVELLTVTKTWNNSWCSLQGENTKFRANGNCTNYRIYAK